MRNAQILIVEDEGIVAADLAQRLERMGYTVVGTVASGIEAMEKTVALRPDLVLMDIHLRGELDGIDAATQIRRTRIDVPVIYLTAYADETTLARAKVADPLGYILKPFDERELQVTLEMALAKREMERALEQQRAEFLAMLINDIRNPLETILGFAQMLRTHARERKSTEEEEMLQQLEHNALTVHTLVANYLQETRIDTGPLVLHPQSLLLNELLEKIGRQYQSGAQQRCITLIVDLPETSPMITGDLLALERVFANLLYNVLKFTPELGQIVIRARHSQGEVEAMVTGSGPGIPNEEIEAIFDKSRRTGRAPQREGIKVGLHIVKVLVEAHGGRVEVVSALGAGARFSVFLPTL